MNGTEWIRCIYEEPRGIVCEVEIKIEQYL